MSTDDSRNARARVGGGSGERQSCSRRASLAFKLANTDCGRSITATDVTRHSARSYAKPFLLERVLDGTEGRSLEANITLVRNNARLAAELAVALAKASPT